MSIAIVFFDLGDTLVTSDRHWIAGAQPLLHSLRQAGLELGIISNTGNLSHRADILKLLPADFDLSPFEAHLVIFSSEVGKEKPRAAIFQEAVARSGLPATQCLYCSEDIVETLMAQSVGMHSIRLQPAINDDLKVLPKRIQEFLAAGGPANDPANGP